MVSLWTVSEVCLVYMMWQGGPTNSLTSPTSEMNFGRLEGWIPRPNRLKTPLPQRNRWILPCDACAWCFFLAWHFLISTFPIYAPVGYAGFACTVSLCNPSRKEAIDMENSKYIFARLPPLSQFISLLSIFFYLEPNWPLCSKVNPPKQGPFSTKKPMSLTGSRFTYHLSLSLSMYRILMFHIYKSKGGCIFCHICRRQFQGFDDNSGGTLDRRCTGSVQKKDGQKFEKNVLWNGVLFLNWERTGFVLVETFFFWAGETHP